MNAQVAYKKRIAVERQCHFNDPKRRFAEDPNEEKTVDAWIAWWYNLETQQINS